MKTVYIAEVEHISNSIKIWRNENETNKKNFERVACGDYAVDIGAAYGFDRLVFNECKCYV